MYIKYLKYILKHKKHVFKSCWKRGLYIHAFTHDLSKLLPDEFIPNAKYFCKNNNCKGCDSYTSCNDKEYNDFQEAVNRHYKRNKHHWKYWIGQRMPYKYIMQMICDWEAMSIQHGNTVLDYYISNYDKIELEHDSRVELEFQLGVPYELIMSNMTLRQYCDRMNITLEEGYERIKLQ